MLSNNREKYTQCPCCKVCANCSGLKETVEVQGAGPVRYQQTQPNQLNRNIKPVKTNSTGDIFVLQHTTDKKLAMFGHISTQELQNIDCPRCKYIIEHAEKRMQTKGHISKNVAIGVCDHCRNKVDIQIPCYERKDIAKKFITSSKEKSEDLEHKRRTWLPKVKHLHKDAKIDAEISDTQIESPALSKSHVSKLHGITYKDYTFRKVEDPKTKIRSKPIKKGAENEISISNIKQVYRTRSFDSYLQKLENASNLTDTLKLWKRYRSKPDRIMSPVRRDDAYSADKTYTRKPDQEKRLDIQDFNSSHQTFKKYISKPEQPTPRGYDPFYKSDKKYVTKDDVKKLFDTEYYDINYREDTNYEPEPGSTAVSDVNEYTSHYQHQEKEFVTPFDEDKLLQQIYLKRHPLDIKKPITVGEEKDKKKQASKFVKLTLEDTSVLTGSIYRTKSETSMLDLEKVSVPKGIVKSATELYSERKPKIDFTKSDDYIEHYVSSTLPTHKTGKGKKYTDITSVHSSPNKKYTSEEALYTKSEIKNDFSYQFPKEIISKKELKHLQTSVELIQETQNMLNMREEEKKQKIEIERTRKLLEQEIKNKAREEKKRIQEDKRKEEEEHKRIAEEERKKIAEENRILEDERKKEEEKLKAKAEKKIKADDKVKLKEKTKTELSEEEKRKAKEEKEKSKEERKNALEEKRKEKEESREKAKSEKVDNEKEKADKEADKLKKQKEKEIQLRMQKEEKQREKEENERLKKEKDEQLRAEKARVQGEKEEEQQNKQTTAKKGKRDDDKKSMPESKQPNTETSKEQQKEKNEATAEDFKKIRNDFNSKDEALKRKNEVQLEKRARDEADKKEKEIEKQGKIRAKEAKAVVKPELVKDIIKTDEKKDKPTIKELDIKQIKVRKPSYDDLILRLVKLKQSEPRERERIKQKTLPVLDVPVVAREHKKHKYTKTSKCIMCIDSEFELDVESILMKTDLLDDDMKDIIIGQKIFKYKPPLVDKEDKSIMMPSLFQSTFQADSPIVIKKEPEIVVKDETVLKPAISVPAKSPKLVSIKQNLS